MSDNCIANIWIDIYFSLLPYKVCALAGKPELRSEVDVIVADVGEPDSLAAMCKQAVIVLNCVGPVSRRFPKKYINL